MILRWRSIPLCFVARSPYSSADRPPLQARVDVAAVAELVAARAVVRAAADAECRAVIPYPTNSAPQLRQLKKRASLLDAQADAARRVVVAAPDAVAQ